MDGCGDGGGEAREPDLADSAGADGVDLLVRLVEELGLECRNVGIDGHDVVREIAVDGRAVLRVVGRVLEESHADAHDDGALDLVSAGEGIDDAAGVHDGDDSADTESGNLRLPGDL